MKLAFEEVWSFLRLIKGDEASWSFKLVAGECQWEQLDTALISQLENDPYYDAELLPNLFTFREIFWQPNVYPTLNACLTGLKLVSSYGEELAQEQSSSGEATHQLYADLVKYVGNLALRASEQLAGVEEAADRIPSVIGEFRKQSFPVIMFFIHHPMNRIDYREDAMRRVNFMVKTLLDQYQLRFNDLMMPYWELSRVEKPVARPKKRPEGDQPSEGPAE